MVKKRAVFLSTMCCLFVGHVGRSGLRSSFVPFLNGFCLNITPPKTNMEPENGPLEKEVPIGNHHFQVPC